MAFRVRYFVILLACVWAVPAGACCVCDALAAPSCGMMAADSATTDGDSPALAFYSVQGSQWPQPGGDGTPVTITYSYNNFLDGGLLDPDGNAVSADYLRLVTEEAFGLWASVAPLHFVEVADVGTFVANRNQIGTYTFNYRDLSEDDYGDIRISHWYRDGPDTPTLAKPKAEAYFPDASEPLAGDIFFDNGDPWAVIGTSSEPDVLGIMTHEIGHSIGIAHSNVEGSVMFPAALRRNGPGTGLLTADDIAAVQAIYGAGVGSVTALVPEPTTIAAVGGLTLIALGRRRAPGGRSSC